jgi:hypothetical protein
MVRINEDMISSIVPVLIVLLRGALFSLLSSLYRGLFSEANKPLAERLLGVVSWQSIRCFQAFLIPGTLTNSVDRNAL